MQHINIFENGHIVKVKFLDTIKLNNLILLKSPDRKEAHVCAVVKIHKGKRHSREDGYPYTFTGEKDGKIYTETFYSGNMISGGVLRYYPL